MNEMNSQILDIAKNNDFFYLLNLDHVENQVDRFISVFQRYLPNFIFAYSYKSNGMPSITKIIKDKCGTAEVVSGTELEWALKDGFMGSDIFFDGPVKTEEEIKFALSHGVTIQVDSLEEAEIVLNLKENMQSNSKITVRLSTIYRDDEFSRFGLEKKDLTRAKELFEFHSDVISGIHFHVGSNVNTVQPWIETLQYYEEFIVEILSNSETMPTLDIGGGYPCESQRSGESLLNIEEWPKKISNELKNMGIALDRIALVTEPGRHFVEQFGVMFSRVGAIKKFPDYINLMLCTGTNFVRSFRGWRHDILLLDDTLSEVHAGEYDCKIYGRNCFESDFFRDVSSSTMPSTSNWVKITNCGGYDIPSTNPWITPLPPVFGIKKGKLISLRLQQTNDELRLLWENR